MKILVVEARGLPVGFLGSYGNDWVATPALDRLAADGVVFDRHIAECPDLHDDTPTWRHPGLVTQATLPDLEVDKLANFSGVSEIAESPFSR